MALSVQVSTCDHRSLPLHGKLEMVKLREGVMSEPRQAESQALVPNSHVVNAKDNFWKEREMVDPVNTEQQERERTFLLMRRKV